MAESVVEYAVASAPSARVLPVVITRGGAAIGTAVIMLQTPLGVVTSKVTVVCVAVSVAAISTLKPITDGPVEGFDSESGMPGIAAGDTVPLVAVTAMVVPPSSLFRFLSPTITVNVPLLPLVMLAGATANDPAAKALQL